MAVRNRTAFTFSTFEFDTSSGELSQNGMRVRISKQTADILTVLLLNAGSLVTRQQIREILWPGGDQVDHDKIINNGISRLRYIFKDDPQNPTFIERVPKRGYRLLIPVKPSEFVGSPAQELEQSPSSSPQPYELHPSELQTNTPLAPLKQAFYSGPEVMLPARESDIQRRVRSRWISAPWKLLALVFLSTLAVGLAGALVLWWHKAHRTPVATAPKEISLAIAPLDTRGDAAAELAESFRLDLTDALAQLPHVEVRAAHSVNQLHLTDASYPTYSSRLGIDVLLFGHLSVADHTCQIEFELVRGRDAAHLATLRYSGTIDQLASIRDQIQRDVFTKLQIGGTNGGHPRGSTSDPVAYESYLQARYHFSQQTPESLAQSVKEYSLAIERDPNFAKAYVGLAQTQLVRLSDDYITPREGFTQASEAIDKAQRLDPSNAQAYSILGFIRFYRDWDFAGGIDEAREAVLLDPHQAIYHQWLAALLCDAGRYREAISEVEIAQSDDPYWPSLYTTEAHVALNARDYKRVLVAARKLKELLPESVDPYDVMANALWYNGHYEEGIAEWRRMAILEGDQERVKMEDAGLAAFRKGGIPGYARIRIQALTGGEAARHPSDFDPFEWYMAAGDRKTAIAILKAKVANHDHVLLETLMGPFSDPIYNDPAFQAIFNTPGLSALKAVRFHP